MLKPLISALVDSLPGLACGKLVPRHVATCYVVERPGRILMLELRWRHFNELTVIPGHDDRSVSTLQVRFEFPDEDNPTRVLPRQGVADSVTLRNPQGS